MYVLIGIVCVALFFAIRKFVFNKKMFGVSEIRIGMFSAFVFWLFVFGFLLLFGAKTNSVYQAVDLFVGLCLLTVPVTLLISEYFGKPKHA